jgi:hypothetical protein
VISVTCQSNYLPSRYAYDIHRSTYAAFPSDKRVRQSNTSAYQCSSLFEEAFSLSLHDLIRRPDPFRPSIQGGKRLVRGGAKRHSADAGKCYGLTGRHEFEQVGHSIDGEVRSVGLSCARRISSVIVANRGLRFNASAYWKDKSSASPRCVLQEQPTVVAKIWTAGGSAAVAIIVADPWPTSDCLSFQMLSAKPIVAKPSSSDAGSSFAINDVDRA